MKLNKPSTIGYDGFLYDAEKTCTLIENDPNSESLLLYPSPLKLRGCWLGSFSPITEYLFSRAFRSCRLPATSNIFGICSGASLTWRRRVTLSVLNVHLDNLSAKLGSLLEVRPISRVAGFGFDFSKSIRSSCRFWCANNALMLVLAVEQRNKFTLSLKDGGEHGYF